MARKSKGRQKINMEKMQNESNLQVTFSKRRSGLFKKASELCTLCGTEVALVVFSPGKKVFSFGHPNVEPIIDRFLSRDPQPNDNTYMLIEAHRKASVHDLNMRLTQVENQLEAERKLGESLNQMTRSSQSQRWWEAPIEEQNLQQLELLKTAMEELKKDVTKQVEKIANEEAKALPFLAGTSRSFGPFDASSSSSMMPHRSNLGHGFL